MSCFAEELHQDLLHRDQKFKQDIEKFDSDFNYTLNNSQNKPDALVPYIIPLVVHVIVPPGTALGFGNNITDAQIKSGLKNLNSVFRNTNEYTNSNGNDAMIEFCLAKRDEQGNQISGIYRHESNLVNDSDCGSPTMNSSNDVQVKALSKLNCKKFLNIWLVTNILASSCSVVGYAYFPNANCAYDGVVMESSYWDTKDGVLVAAHEIGHYLGLHHTFFNGCVNNNCQVDGDMICDTPPDDSAPFANCNINSCNTDVPDLKDNSENIMDYSSCKPIMFTPQQILKMRYCLESSRKSLLEEYQCLSPLKNDAEILDLFSDKQCEGNHCFYATVQNRGNEAISSLTLEMNLNGSKFTRQFNENISVDSTKSITIYCTWLVGGVYNFSAVIKEINGNAVTKSDVSISVQIDKKPKINILKIDSSNCGKNGQVEFINLNVNDRITIVDSSTNVSSDNLFLNNLSPGNHRIIISNQFGCDTTIDVKIYDRCPPCISGVINRYSPVVQFCYDVAAEVENVSNFQVKNKVLIIQMQGAVIDSSNSTNFGNLININNAGNYEINEIDKIQGNNIYFKYLLANKYDPSGQVQIVYIPEYDTVSVCNLTCKSWDGRTGGVLIFNANHVKLEGQIDVSNKGFRGGEVGHAPDVVENFRDFYSDNFQDGGKKGEGVAKYLYRKEFCRGKNLNGGGGANNHNTGGGGGALAGYGGQGGYFTFFPINQSGLGLGGTKIDFDCTTNKMFMGGGGGAGHSNLVCAAGTSGGNGGGIIIIETKTMTASSPNIEVKSNGETALDADKNSGNNLHKACDGTGGGGSAGTIFLNYNQIISPFKVSLEGGKGGNIFWITNVSPLPYGLGPGGGGSGGYFFSSQNTILPNVNLNGGKNGLFLNYSPPSNEGSTPGTNGQSKLACSLLKATIPYVKPIISISKINSICDSQSTTITVNIVGKSQPYKVFFNGKYDSSNTIKTDQYGNISISILDSCGLVIDTSLAIEKIEILQDSILFLQHETCNSLGLIKALGYGGYPPYSYKLNGTSNPEGLFTNLKAGTHQLIVTDSLGCTRTRNIIINKITSQLDLEIDTSDLRITCGDSSVIISIKNKTTQFGNYFNLNDSIIQNHGTFIITVKGTYKFKIFNENGCDTINFTAEILNSSITSLDTIQYQKCESDTLVIQNKKIVSNGYVPIAYKNINNCDSLIIYDVINNPNDTNYVRVSICEGEVYKTSQNSYSIQGKYYEFYNISSALKCDSILDIDLTILKKSDSTVTYKKCPTDTLLINNQVYSKEGKYIQVLQNFQKCDSTLTINIIDQPETNIDLYFNYCLGDTIRENGQIAVKDTMFIVNVNSTKDCDTTKIFHIQVSPPRLTAQNITICEGESYFINNKSYSQTGFYLDTLISAKGCDSIVQTFLKINPKDTNSQIIIKCENKQITINGIQIEDSGEYSFPFKNRYGCDSTLKIEVRNKPLSSFFVDTLLCIGQNLIIKNRIYNEEGNYIDTLIGQNQCDSFVSTIIKLKDCNHIFVPNVFSPNGDGLNDKFEIFGEGIESLYVEIYSRWGELLFKSDQLNVFWDGTVRGELAMPGTYVYVIKASFSWEPSVVLTGDVNLLR